LTRPQHSAQNQASGESASITPSNTDPGQARIAMASGDREWDFNGDLGRGDGVEPARHPAPDSPSQGQPWRPPGYEGGLDSPDPRTIRTPPAGAGGLSDLTEQWAELYAWDPVEGRYKPFLQPSDRFGEPRRGHNVAPPRRPVNAEDVRLGLGSHRSRAPQASPRAEAVPGAARATRADELQALQGPEGWPWLMTPVEESVPESGSPPTALWWLVALVTAATMALALAALVEWLR
jgi:hypothetical protein